MRNILCFSLVFISLLLLIFHLLIRLSIITLYNNKIIILLHYFYFIYRTANLKEGTISMNGKERNLSQFRKLSAYIMQDNQLHGNLTVEEAMSVAASLKLSTQVDKKEKVGLVSIYIYL